MLQSYDCQPDDALQTYLSILAVARSLGEEPFMMSALVRGILQTVTVQGVERGLGQGDASDRVLAAAQLEFAREAKQPALLNGLRGERAGMYLLMGEMEAGKIDLESVSGGRKNKRSPGPPSAGFSLYVLSGGFKKDTAWMLRFHNQAVEAAKLAPADTCNRFQELDQSLLHAPLLSRLFCTALAKVAERTVRAHVLLECAVTGLGVERFRMQKGRWPESLDEVVAAKLLEKVPIDPFNGKTIGFRKASDGVVVYSVGQDGFYAGDALDADTDPTPSIIRTEFRLWDEAHRRQPPRARAKEDDKYR
jgi:hypothetical protein